MRSSTFVTAAGGTVPTPGQRQEREGRKKKNGPIYDSVNLLPYFQGNAKGDPHEALIWRMSLRGSAIRMGNWKLLRPNSMNPMLFDLGKDMGETTNLLHEQPVVAERLLEHLNTWETKLERNPLFVSSPYWLGYNRRLYAKEFSRTQPKPDGDQDIWSFAKNKR